MEYYDRNPIYQRLQFGAFDLSGHITTTRITYVVPSGRRARIEYVAAGFTRCQIAQTLGLCHIDMFVNGTYFFDLDFSDNSLYATNTEHRPVGIFLTEGDTITVHDNSTDYGGGVNFAESIFITEYDP